MNSKTTTPSTSNPLVATQNNGAVDKAEKIEFSNSARDIFKFGTNNDNYNFAKEGENLIIESSDVFDYIKNIVPYLLAEVRKNDQSRCTAGEPIANSDPNVLVPHAINTDQDDPADVIDIVSSEPPSLPVISVADRYARSLLKCLAGYPLYEPEPFSDLSVEYLRHGVNVGDVGFVRDNGVFDFLFNVCPLWNGSINPPNLSDGFSLETSECSATRAMRPFPHESRLFQSPVTKTKSGEYICEGSEGAILELPEGAKQEEATNVRPFEKLAACRGIQWYEYAMNRGRAISNGSLYLITSFTKCSQWGTAVFDRPCASGQGLRFDKKSPLHFGKSTSKYHWNGASGFPTKVSSTNKGETQNQCVFLQGYKIMIRQDIFDNLCSNDRSRRSDSTLHPNLSSYLVHPSDIINAALLNQNPGANVAITHDDVWCNLVRDNFPKLNYTTLMSIACSYTSTVDEYDCVSLERISDSTNILSEKNYPLRDVGSSTLRGAIQQDPLITSDEDCNQISANISVSLPSELVERILLLLDARLILKCRLLSREFNEIIQSSTLLQYFLACRAAGVIDNPRSPLSCAERLDMLKKREDGWRKLKPMFEMTITVNHPPSPENSLSAGACLLGDKNLKDLHYCHLPSSLQDNPQWIRMPIAQRWFGVLSSFGTAIYEHDLIIKVISSDVGNQATRQPYSVDLFLLKFSTGEAHPLARHSRIHVQMSNSRPWSSLRIVGDNLALILRGNITTIPDKLFIFDWKTGHKQLEHKAAVNTYSSPVFISPELLLIPNIALFQFEVWHLPPSHYSSKPPRQILSLQMPTLSPTYSVFSFLCRGEPNPFLDSIPYFPPRPFFTSPENSLIIANVRLTRHMSYTFITHRQALIDTIQRWTSPPLGQEDLSTWLTNEVTVNRYTDLDDGSVRLDVQSCLFSMKPHIRSPRTRGSTFNTPTSLSELQNFPESSSSSIPSESPTSQYDFLQVKWADWGPPISRWFQSRDPQAWYITTMFGQRCVLLSRSPHGTGKSMVSVVDFNPHNVRRSAEVMARAREDEDNDSNGYNGVEKGEGELEMLEHEGVFLDEVYMGLKCVVYHAPDEYDFDVVLMDEERLLGLEVDCQYRAKSIKVLYLG